MTITATRITYGNRVTFNHPRWCSVCGCQRATEAGKFIAHQKPNAKPGDPDCPNSGKSVKVVNEEAQG